VQTTDTPTGRELAAAIATARRAYHRHRRYYINSLPGRNSRVRGREASDHARRYLRHEGESYVRRGLELDSQSMVTLGQAYRDLAEGRITISAR